MCCTPNVTHHNCSEIARRSEQLQRREQPVARTILPTTAYAARKVKEQGAHVAEGGEGGGGGGCCW
jgi:hypothetical protein